MIMKIASKCWVTGCLWAVVVSVQAQPGVAAAPQNVVQLSATAALEVQQDWLTLTLSTSRDGSDAQAVQAQLKAALDSALVEARSNAESDALQVRTGQFSLVPRRGREGRIDGWQGVAELLLEGRDIARISAVAGRIQSLTVAHAAFSLSRGQQAALESQVQAQAIERFKLRATEVARAFGFASYTLREVAVSSSEPNPSRPRLLAMAAPVAAQAAVPVEAGKATVQVTVNGSVQLK